MRKSRVERGSENVFRDLGFPDPEEALLKANLAAVIGRRIRARNFTQSRVADVLGIGQSKVSDLLRGKLRGFSVERLLGFVMKLGHDVEISVHQPHSGRGPGHLRLSA